MKQIYSRQKSRLQFSFPNEKQALLAAMALLPALRSVTCLRSLLISSIFSNLKSLQEFLVQKTVSDSSLGFLSSSKLGFSNGRKLVQSFFFFYTQFHMQKKKKIERSLAQLLRLLRLFLRRIVEIFAIIHSLQMQFCMFWPFPKCGAYLTHYSNSNSQEFGPSSLPITNIMKRTSH